MEENKKIRDGARYCPIVFIVCTVLICVLISVIYDSDKLETVKYYRDGVVSTEIASGIPSQVDGIFVVGSLADAAIGIACWVLLILDKKVNKRKIRTRVLIMIPTGVLLILILLLGLGSVGYYRGEADGSNFASKYSPEYYEYCHDDKRIVVCEYSWLLGGWGTVYQVGPDDRMTQIGRFGTDDGYRNQGEYDIKWEEDGISLTYTYDPNASEPDKEIFCNWSGD